MVNNFKFQIFADEDTILVESEDGEFRIVGPVFVKSASLLGCINFPDDVEEVDYEITTNPFEAEEFLTFEWAKLIAAMLEKDGYRDVTVMGY